MIEILDIREATDEEIHSTDRYEEQLEQPEWKKKMMDNFLRRPACKHTCFGAAAGDCGRCAE